MSDTIENAEQAEATATGGVTPEATNSEAAKVEDNEGTENAKSLDEMTPEELRAEMQKISEERDDWRSQSRKNEDGKKANWAQLKKLEDQLNATKPAELTATERIAALEAEINATKKEAEILKLAKEFNLPDAALTLLQGSSLEELPEMVKSITGLIEQLAQATPSKPSLPINKDQGGSSKAKGLQGADLELQKLLNDSL